MPVTKSANKALKVSIRRKAENDLVRAKVKCALKGVKISIGNREADVADKMKSVYSELDLAAKKNVIHKNKAARLKSRIMHLAKKVSETEVSEPKQKVKKAVAKKTATKKK